MTTPASPPSASSKNASAPAGSSCEVGSSSRSSSGSSASADARQTRCSSPPEISVTRRASEPGDPDCSERSLDSRQDRVRRRADVLERERDLARRRGRGSPGPPDPGRPLRRFPRARSAACCACRGRPPRRVLRTGRRGTTARGPASARTSVDLPEPEAPRSSTTSPRSTSSETSRSAGGDSGYANVSRSTRARATALRSRRRQRATTTAAWSRSRHGAAGTRVLPERPKPRASIASARLKPRSSDPATSGESSAAWPRRPSGAIPRPRNASTSPRASRSNVGTSRVASAAARTECRAVAAASSRS